MAFPTYADAFANGCKWDTVVEDVIDSTSKPFDVMKSVLMKVAHEINYSLPKAIGPGDKQTSISEYHKTIPCHLECTAVLVSVSDV